MMRDHLYRRLAAGMAAGLLIQAAPSAWAARTAAVGGMVAAGRRGIPPEWWRSRGGRHLHLECRGSGGPTLLLDRHRIGNVIIKRSLTPGRPHSSRQPDRRINSRSAFSASTGNRTQLFRLRYGGSAHSFGFAIYSAASDRYEDAVLRTGLPIGTPQEALDTACTVHLAAPGHEPEP